jgi:glycosyltransferase involved in cell wall biosynthesis
MKYSVIMPSRLIPYKGCAELLNKKLLRSMRGVLDQTFKDFELIVIADGCKETKEIVSTVFTDERLVLLECNHKVLWDNTPRNTGLENARGEYIIYCDIDDFWGEKHLEIINKNMDDYDWIWYNDFILKETWQERACNIKSLGGCGTSNITHKSSLGIIWERPGYAHDFYFVQKLLMFKGIKIETPEYFVCHIPNVYDV